MQPTSNKPAASGQDSAAARQQEHVILITHSYPRFKGDWRSNFIEALANGYQRNGALVTVLVPNTVGWQRTAEPSPGIRLHTYNYLPRKRWQVFGYGDAMKGDLHVNPLHALMLPCMILCGALQLRRLLRAQGANFVQAHWAIPNTLIALLGRFLSGTKVPVFTSFPGSDVTAITRAKVFGKLLARWIARSDFLSCNSSDLKEDLVLAGIPRDRIDLVIYGVDAQAMHFDAAARSRIRTAFGYSDDDVVLLCIGRFVAKKGFATAIKAMPTILARHPNAKLLLIGSGLLEQEYHNLIKDAATAAAIHMPGEVDPACLKDYYSASDIFLMPSERHPSDGLNVVVVEAMACARPIVASSVGGNDLVVFENVNGFLHKAGDADALALALDPLIVDGAQRMAMGKKSRQLVDERFSWPAIAALLLAKSRHLAA